MGRCAVAVDEELHGWSTDADPLYRVAALAVLAPLSPESSLAAWARAECRLTHRSEVVQTSCVALVLLLAAALRLEPFEPAARQVAFKVSCCFPVRNAILEGLDDKNGSSLSRGSYCVDVLKAVVFCVRRSGSGLATALQTARTIAGASNYCVPLVGGVVGARLGCPSLSNPNTDPTQTDILNFLRAHLKQWEPRDISFADSHLSRISTARFQQQR